MLPSECRTDEELDGVSRAMYWGRDRREHADSERPIAHSARSATISSWYLRFTMLLTKHASRKTTWFHPNNRHTFGLHAWRSTRTDCTARPASLKRLPASCGDQVYRWWLMS